MTDVVDALVAAITPAVLWSNIENLVPWLVVIVPFAIGLYFLRKLVKGASKAKVRF